MMDYQEDLQKFNEYLRALEEERRKIEMFQRELPLCLEIVTQAIESYKQQLPGRSTTTATTTECSEQTTSDGPVFEEFIPLKRTFSSTRQHQEQEDDNDDEELGSHKNSADCDEKKSDWLSSVQLWNQSPDPPSTTADKEHATRQPKKVGVVEVMRNGNMEMEIAKAALRPPLRKEEAGQQQRKSRRCWSQELHRRFLNALDQLGGSHSATPKQIRDLMKVDGLTNDEVKSHLQKYRLHSRRPTTNAAAAAAAHNNGMMTKAPAPQFVVVGGIWMPPPPLPARQSAGSSSLSEGGGRCNSPTTSSSTHTATASPAY